MPKPGRKHIAALHRSIRLLENGLDTVVEEKFRQGIASDIESLQEILSMFWYMIENPTLPFASQGGNGELKDGDTDNTTYS